MFAFWSWVAGAAAGCRCKVRLSDCCLRFGAARCCPVPGFFSFSRSLFSGPEEPCAAVGMPLGLVQLVLAALCFFLMLHLRWCCEQQKQHQQKQQRFKQQHQQRTAAAAAGSVLLLRRNAKAKVYYDRRRVAPPC